MNFYDFYFQIYDFFCEVFLGDGWKRWYLELYENDNGNPNFPTSPQSNQKYVRNCIKIRN